jgi:hypothetical protein
VTACALILQIKIMCQPPVNSAKTAGQEPFKAEFATLGKATWFALESMNRARNNTHFEGRLDAAGKMHQQISSMGLDWMPLGEWSKRRSWTDDHWVNYLRKFHHHAGQVFLNTDGEVSAQEKQLIDAFQEYWSYFAALPDRPKDTPEDDNGNSMKESAARVDQVLQKVTAQVGDPLTACAKCQRCAIGRALKRCGRCQNVRYCSVECQQGDWMKHKKKCASMSSPAEKQNDNQEEPKGLPFALAVVFAVIAIWLGRYISPHFKV